MFAGTSASLLDHPKLASESRNCVEAMMVWLLRMFLCRFYFLVQCRGLFDTSFKLNSTPCEWCELIDGASDGTLMHVFHAATVHWRGAGVTGVASDLEFKAIGMPDSS